MTIFRQKYGDIYMIFEGLNQSKEYNSPRDKASGCVFGALAAVTILGGRQCMIR